MYLKTLTHSQTYDKYIHYKMVLQLLLQSRFCCYHVIGQAETFGVYNFGNHYRHTCTLCAGVYRMCINFREGQIFMIFAIEVPIVKINTRKNFVR